MRRLFASNRAIPTWRAISRSWDAELQLPWPRRAVRADPLPTFHRRNFPQIAPLLRRRYVRAVVIRKTAAPTGGFRPSSPAWLALLLRFPTVLLRSRCRTRNRQLPRMLR